MKTKKKTVPVEESQSVLERAKERYKRSERKLIKARTALSNAYAQYDDSIRYERLVKKLGYEVV